MKFLIISGMSGAGKSRAAAILEDMDFYCVDNMPVVLIPKFTELCLATRGRYERVALVTDVRGRESFDDLFKALDEMSRLGCDYEILFMEASLDVLVKRYKETRRRHPLSQDSKDIEEAVEKERKLIASIRERADYIIDTTEMLTGRLQRELLLLFGDYDGEKSLISVNVVSFGYKFGIPIDADLVFDVRFLPNPYYVESLKMLCGLDKPVFDYVMNDAGSKQFMQKLCELVDYLMPRYIDEGKRTLVIGVGCTGGRHRSVAVAKALADHLDSVGYRAANINRDMDKLQ